MILEHTYYSIGYGITVPGIYFNRVILAGSLDQFSTVPNITELKAKYVKQLEDIGPHYVSIITNVVQHLQVIQYEVNSLPKVPDEYFKWFGDINTNIRSQLETRSLPELFYLYGFELGNMMVSLAVYEWALQMQSETNNAVNMSATLARVQQDLRNSHFRTPGVATLIGANSQYIQVWQKWEPLMNALKNTIAMFGDNKPDQPSTVIHQLQTTMTACAQAHTAVVTVLKSTDTSSS